MLCHVWLSYYFVVHIQGSRRTPLSTCAAHGVCSRETQEGSQAAAAGKQVEAGGSSMIEHENDYCCSDSECGNLDSAEGMDHDDDCDADYDGDCDEGCADYDMAVDYSYEQDAVEVRVCAAVQECSRARLVLHDCQT